VEKIVVEIFGASIAWQDIVIAVGQWIFAIALIPALRAKGKDKPPISTSLLTGTILIIFAFTFFTLNLWNAAVSALVVSVCWFTLVIQKKRLQNSEDDSV